MAIYNLEEFQTLVLSSKLEFLNVRRTTNNLDKLDWDNNKLKKMLCGMNSDDFQKTVKNCKINDCPSAEYVDADQYEVHWDEDACIRRNRNDLARSTVSLSLKIAIITLDDGELAGLVTFHLSGSPN